MERPKNGATPARDRGNALKQADGEGYAKHERAQVCDHARTITERMPEGHAHYAADVCRKCAQHLTWLPSPRTLEKQWVNSQRLEQLSRCGRLNSWERSFVHGMLKLRKFSPRQQGVIDALCEQHLWRREAES